mgnify:CR=1 FL=1
MKLKKINNSIIKAEYIEEAEVWGITATENISGYIIVATEDRIYEMPFRVNCFRIYFCDEDDEEIEEFIYTCDKVKDVQVIGVPDKRYGEEIMACIILKDGEAMTEEEMKQYIADHMARHKVPRYIEFVSSFPMNAAGKILKYKMREDAAKRLGLEE